jgi:hypothetical protein
MSNHTIKAKNKNNGKITNINVIDYGNTCEYYDDDMDCLYTPTGFNDLFEVVEDRFTKEQEDKMKQTLKIITSKPSEYTPQTDTDTFKHHTPKKYKVKIRRGNNWKVKPEAEELDGKVFNFKYGWTFDEDEMYAGEYAMQFIDENQPLSWMASGDLIPYFDGEDTYVKTDTFKKEDLFIPKIVFDKNNGFGKYLNELFLTVKKEMNSNVDLEYWIAGIPRLALIQYADHFITQEIAKAKEEILEEIEKYKKTQQSYDEVGLINDVIDDIIQLIQNNK